MLTAAVPPLSHRVSGIFARLMLALLFGVQFGLVLVIRPGWLFVAALAVLLIALLLSLLVDARARQRLFFSGRVAPALWVLGIVLVSLLPMLMVPLQGEGELEVIVLEMPILVALTVGRQSLLMAIGASLLAWAGFGSVVLYVTYQAAATQQGGDTGALQFIFAVMLIIPAFGLAAIAGMLGHLLNQRAFK